MALGLAVTLHFLYVDQLDYLREDEIRGQIFGRDFAAFWTASAMVLSGRAAEVFETAAFMEALRGWLAPGSGFNAFPYPPIGLIPILPLALLPYGLAFAAWMIGLLVLYVLATGGRDRRAARVTVLLFAPATLLTVAMGQNGLLSAVLLVGGLRLLGSRPLLAGLLFGLLTFKPHLGLLIPIALLFGRHWTALLAATATTIALFAWSLWFVGFEAWETYLRVTVPNQRIFFEQGSGFFRYMVPSPFMAARLLGADVIVGHSVQAVTALAALGGVAWTFRRRVEPELRAAVLLIGTLLTSPYVFNYDMTLLSVAVLYLTERALREGFLVGERLVLGAAWLLPVFVMYANVERIPIGPLLLVAPFGLALYRGAISSGARRDEAAAQTMASVRNPG